MKKGEKGLKNASFWVINFRNFRGGVFRPPLHPHPAVGRGFAPPAAYLFVQNYIKKGEKGLKNASFGVINSSPRPPHLCTLGEKLISMEGWGDGRYIV